MELNQWFACKREEDYDYFFILDIKGKNGLYYGWAILSKGRKHLEFRQEYFNHPKEWTHTMLKVKPLIMKFTAKMPQLSKGRKHKMIRDVWSINDDSIR